MCKLQGADRQHRVHGGAVRDRRVQQAAHPGPPLPQPRQVRPQGLQHRPREGAWATFGGGVTESEAEAIVEAAYYAGINLFDLSEAHSGPRAEIELGQILKRKAWKRTSYVVTTKIYFNSKSEERGLSRKHIIESVKASLQRLQLDYIDVVILHKCDPMCPTEETVRAMNHVISQGWAMYWGTAKWTPVEIMEAYSNCRQFNCITPIIEQAEYHMFCREKAELYMAELYNKIGVGLVAWSPISMGLVSTKSSTEEPSAQILSRSALKGCCGKEKSNLGQAERLRLVEAIAERLGCSLTQLSIAWASKNDSVQCLLLGATAVQHLYHCIHSLQAAVPPGSGTAQLLPESPKAQEEAQEKHQKLPFCTIQ
ncbi:unnamed protein product [Nezara viridula]|uniref:NADP-dependent oxidoreductase domain-containing protein n=1 Tax=Nezara viridula TaxID=85310 RepID=A0A9P0H4X0_NEZVI|nr:unnamed protein product [Nezara viridula]